MRIARRFAAFALGGVEWLRVLTGPAGFAGGASRKPRRRAQKHKNTPHRPPSNLDRASVSEARRETNGAGTGAPFRRFIQAMRDDSPAPLAEEPEIETYVVSRDGVRWRDYDPNRD